MNKLTKHALCDLALGALKDAGWTITPVETRQTHPVVFVMEKDQVAHTVEMYIWNLSDGGRSLADEYRIQITHAEHGFETKPDVKTVLLGWHEDFGVFAGFDVARRRGRRPQRHSVQIAGSTLAKAATDGGALQDKGGGEWAAAIRPDFLHRYVQSLELVHRGDLPSLYGDHAPLELVAALAGRDGRSLAFGSAAERREREAVLERLRILERQVSELTAQRSRGHNNPPELIEEDASGALDPLVRTTRDLHDNLVKPEPEIPSIAKGAAFLARLRDRLKEDAGKANRLGRRLGAKAEEKVVEIVVGVILTAGTWKHFIDAIERFLAQLARWIHLL